MPVCWVSCKFILLDYVCSATQCSQEHACLWPYHQHSECELGACSRTCAGVPHHLCPNHWRPHWGVCKCEYVASNSYSRWCFFILDNFFCALFYLQTSVPGNRNNVILQNLQPDTPYRINVMAYYADGPGGDLSGDGHTCNNSDTYMCTHIH